MSEPRVIRQFKALPYRIDGYDSINNVAYEIDEKQHNSETTKKKDSKRQHHIEEILKCKFVRIQL